ncbi:hypothetical protein [Saccharophagus degradans]|uniref:Uncharacterized protein n=1 Tax=Saccharophagus degradans TaxID=86304 RepID=A0AAW7X431_9GAMM|nr:hypothetical protein [Saccharophagus degradans]MDO6421376.1 hypothetical protein [Saccharophagus degradans]
MMKALAHEHMQQLKHDTMLAAAMLVCPHPHFIIWSYRAKKGMIKLALLFAGLQDKRRGLPHYNAA